LDRLIEPDTRGDPESPLRWICKSTRNLAAQLTRQKHSVSHEKVAQLLREQNYSIAQRAPPDQLRCFIGERNEQTAARSECGRQLRNGERVDRLGGRQAMPVGN